MNKVVNGMQSLFKASLVLLLASSFAQAQTHHPVSARPLHAREGGGHESPNGGPRGGGDEFVGSKIQPVKRKVLERIQEWVSNGTLHLSADDLKRLLDVTSDPTSTMTNEENNKHLRIYSEEQVQNESWVPPADGAPGHFRYFQVNAANDPHARPPYIDVSQVYWLKIQAEEDQTQLHQTEFFLLHELLSVSEVHDSDFEQSYQVQAKLMDEIVQMKKSFKGFIQKMADIRKKQFELDQGPLNSSLATMMASDNYRICLDVPEHESARANERREIKYCNPIVETFQVNEAAFIRQYIAEPNARLQRELEATRVALNVWYQSLAPQFQRGYFDRSETFIKAITALSDEYNRDSQGFVNSLPDVCPYRLGLAGQFVCLFGKTVNPSQGMPAVFPVEGTAIRKFEDGLDKGNEDRRNKTDEALRTAIDGL